MAFAMQNRGPLVIIYADLELRISRNPQCLAYPLF